MGKMRERLSAAMISLKSHRTRLQMLGVLIVFVTYFVRDGKKEHIKDLTHSLELQEGIFAIRQDVHEIRQLLLGIRVGEYKLKPKSVHGLAKDEFVHVMETFEHNVDLTATDANNIGELVGMLHDPDADNAWQSMQQIEERIKTELTDAERRGINATPPQRFAIITAAPNHMQVAVDRLNNAAKKILSAASITRGSLEIDYNTYSLLATFLYVLGSLITALGVLLDIKPSAT